MLINNRTTKLRSDSELKLKHCSYLINKVRITESLSGSPDFQEKRMYQSCIRDTELKLFCAIRTEVRLRSRSRISLTVNRQTGCSEERSHC